MYCAGQVDQAERDRVHSSPLYWLGDAVLVWANQADLYIYGEEMIAVKDRK